MVLSNKERQARYRARLKAAADSSTALSEALVELLVRHRETILELRRQIALLEDGSIRFLRGNVDATEEALERARRQLADLESLVQRHDAEGVTKIDGD